jgi:hypothetical protein
MTCLVARTLGTIRILTTVDRLPVSRVQLRKCESVKISLYALARDKFYWAVSYDLNEFHSQHKNNLFELMPFGGGHIQYHKTKFSLI